MYRIHISHEGVVYTKKDVFFKFESKDSVHIRLGRTSTPASRLQEPSSNGHATRSKYRHALSFSSAQLPSNLTHLFLYFLILHVIQANERTKSMRVKTLEIRWHDSKPINACDFQPVPPKRARPPPDKERDFASQSYRLATAGDDNNVRVRLFVK